MTVTYIKRKISFIREVVCVAGRHVHRDSEPIVGLFLALFSFIHRIEADLTKLVNIIDSVIDKLVNQFVYRNKV